MDQAFFGMKRLLIAAFLSVLAMPALAQQQQSPSDPALLQRMLSIALGDRAQLLNSLTETQARNQGLTEDLAKAQARIKELEPKADQPPAEK